VGREREKGKRGREREICSHTPLCTIEIESWKAVVGGNMLTYNHDYSGINAQTWTSVSLTPPLVRQWSHKLTNVPVFCIWPSLGVRRLYVWAHSWGYRQTHK
jgi:hypothetical protein